jgi:hypothetical protein
MKIRIPLLVLSLPALAVLGGSGYGATPLGTAFTYQGRLSFGGVPAIGHYDFQLQLFDAASGGVQVGPTITNANVLVSGGSFTTSIDFGPGVFAGDASWLALGVRSNGTSVAFSALTPRQPLQPSPNALYAEQAGTALTSQAAGANSVSSAALQGNSVTAAKIATGQVVKSLNGLTDAVTLAAGANVTLTPSGNQITLGVTLPPSGWSLGGNSGTDPSVNYLGTSDHTPLELRVNGDRVLRLEPASRSSGGGVIFSSTWSANVIGGYSANHLGLGVIGATIAGGGFHSGVLVLGGVDVPNVINADFGSIGGGAGHTIGGRYGTIPGGLNNNIAPGADYAFAAGRSATATQPGSFVWADGRAPTFTSPLANEFAIRAQNGLYLETEHGVRLNAADEPIITRGWDPFDNSAPDGKAYNGRWGMFMEYTELTLGIPAEDVGPRTFAVAKYHPDGTRESLITVGQDGNLACRSLSILGGADLAEPFDVGAEVLEPGAVLVIDELHPGQLKLSTEPYDRRVAGVVSGAGGIHPGVSLRQQGALEGNQNVALTGRVYVMADADASPITPGDMLTTSAIAGHAMKAVDFQRGQGAVLGKAMTALASGRGLVLVLVTLQ